MIRKLLISAWVPLLVNTALAQLDVFEVEAALKRTADWQLSHPNANQGTKVGIRQWHIAPLYQGLLRLSLVTGDSRYLSEVVRQGELANWSPGNRLYHADDYAVGHAWLDIYALDRNHGERFALWKERIDKILADPPTIDLTFRGQKQTDDRLELSHDRWSWCDALYMAPPTLARMYAITGEERYLEFLESEWRLTHSVLYDHEAQLYFRDTRFIDQRLENQSKIHWSRGNGWVYAGLVLTLEKIPQDHSLRTFLEPIFLEMSRALKERQQPDGLWYPNLDDPLHIPTKEASGTALNLFGMAWGINQGLLPGDDYGPVIEQGWQGLLGCVQESGMLGFVQPVGASPENNIRADRTQLYGTGAFLLAGTEILKALGRQEVKDARSLLDRAEAAAFGQGEPEALAVYQPYRMDDIAWENDHMAFRVYGPALEEGTENSGIDCWMKSVPSPVIRKWYAADFAGLKSYHQDHGEGYDGYKVGAARGCGGTALFRDGELETSNVWKNARVIWTRRDEARIMLDYHYNDGAILERKSISLRLGERFCEISSRFYDRRDWQPMAGLPVAVGLTAQSAEPSMRTDPAKGYMAIWDTLPNGDAIGTGVLVEPQALEGFREVEGESATELIAVLKTDSKGAIHYRMGFSWLRSTLPVNMEQWSDFLSAHGAE